MRKLWAVALGAMVSSHAIADDEWQFYLGADQVDAVFSTSTPQTVFTGGNTANFNETDRSDTKFYRLRLGTQLSDEIALELHYGLDDQEADAAENTGSLDTYYGIYIVPQGEIFDLIDVELPIGFSTVEYIGPNGGIADVDGNAYGINLGVSMSRFFEDDERGWDARLVGGGMVYQQDTDSRFYGYNLGLRVSF